MEQRLPETWTTRELPILVAILRRLDAGAGIVELEDVRAELGMDGNAEVWPAIQALMHASPPFLDVDLSNGWRSDHAGGTVLRVGERTRRELGTWPTPETLADRLVAALLAAADAEHDADEKSRLRALAEGLGGFGRDVLVQVTATAIGHAAGTT